MCFAVLGVLGAMLIHNQVLSTKHEAAKMGLRQEEGGARDGREVKERAGDLVKVPAVVCYCRGRLSL